MDFIHLAPIITSGYFLLDHTTGITTEIVNKKSKGREYAIYNTNETFSNLSILFHSFEICKNNIDEIKTACLWKKKSSTFTPDYCPILLDSDPWIVQPSEYYDEIEINALKKKYSK